MGEGLTAAAFEVLKWFKNADKPLGEAPKLIYKCILTFKVLPCEQL